MSKEAVVFTNLLTIGQVVHGKVLEFLTGIDENEWLDANEAHDAALAIEEGQIAILFSEGPVVKCIVVVPKRGGEYEIVRIEEVQ